MAQSATAEPTTQQQKVTRDDVFAAIDQLQSCGRGRAVIKRLHTFLVEGGIGLDGANQNAVVTLLLGAWGPLPGTVRDALNDANRTECGA